MTWVVLIARFRGGVCVGRPEERAAFARHNGTAPVPVWSGRATPQYTGIEPALRSNNGNGWRGRIRTLNPLIQSQERLSGVLASVGKGA